MTSGKYLYTNGNYFVRSDGQTMIKRAKRVGEELISEFPDSIDLKITEKCSFGCKFCHESSTPKGKSFDLGKTVSILSQLPPVPLEIAIGGGDVLDAPNADRLIEWLNYRGHKTRITINVRDLLERRTETEALFRLADAVGISIDSLSALGELKNDTFSKRGSIRLTLFGKDDISIIHDPNVPDHVVLHIIAGIFPVEELETLFEVSEYPVLVLGYKQWGRAENTSLPPELPKFAETLKSLMRKMECLNYEEYFDLRTIGFDNLAIDQLGIRDMYTEKQWNKLYMGDEGTHSMYIDAVKGQFAMTSRSAERVSWDEIGLIDYFKNVKTNK